MTLPIVQGLKGGPQLLSGDEVLAAIAKPKLSYKSGVTAKASGTQANSTPITEAVTQVETVASAADGVLLPAATPGAIYILINSGANAMQVFSASTINGTAGATGISQANATRAIYVCAKAGAWFSILGA